jgi:hypothetical protein
VATVRIEPKSKEQLMAALNRFASDMKITMRDAILEQAALICQDAARFTPPMLPTGGGGLTATAYKTGLRAVEGDIRKIFTAVNDRSANNAASLATNAMGFAVKADDFSGFMKVVGGGKMLNVENLNPIIFKIALDPDRARAFKKAKNIFNRINPRRSEYGTQGFATNLRQIHDKTKGRFGGRMKKGQYRSVVKELVEDKQELNAYIAKRQVAVGTVKSGWLAALMTLPPPTNNNGQKDAFGAELRKAQWLQGKRVAGYNVSSFGEARNMIEVVNTLGNVNGIADDADTLSLVFGNRVKQMPQQVKYRIQPNVDKFNRR